MNLRDDCLVKFANLQYFPLASFARSYIAMVTDEACIAETYVPSSVFLMNIFFALKGSKLFYSYPLVTK